ncbi:MAG TPA: ABC transporter ATP-binding protein [Spirochaetia bacterium]|nr:ABC transporter ATP-binding protein [Spirochaetia bacterium]
MNTHPVRTTRLAGPYVRRYLWPFLAALACLSVESICDLLQPTIMARIVDQGVAARDLPLVLHFGLRMLLVAGIGAAGAAGRNIIASLVSYRFGAQLRADLFQRVTAFSFSEMGGFDAASLITRQTNDVTQVQTFVNGVMRFFAKAPILAFGGLIMAVILEPGLSVVLAVAVPAAAVLIAINLATGFRRFRRVQEGLDGVNSVTREYLGGIRVVKAFGQEAREVRRFADANGELTGASTFALRAMAVFGPAIALTVNLGIVVVLWIGGTRVASSSLQVGKIIAFINYMSQILFSLNVISMIFTQFVRARASWVRISEVLGTPGSEDFQPSAMRAGAAVDGNGAAVEFRGVSFSYPRSRGRPALEQVDLSCAPGGVTAIIGPTGSGKSSLAALVPRFYEPTSGTVRVEGKDVRDFDLRDLRRRIALVPQKTVLFTGTIEENIRWGRPDATDAELREAAAAAQAHEFIQRFPEGYRSILGQSGVNLSGGQKQRVAIARALVRRPDVLVLDDCTSSVDSITEAQILRAVRAPGRTCILITQRVSAAAAADLILVLEDGHAVGVGTHEQLVRESGVYRDICVAQLGKDALHV